MAPVNQCNNNNLRNPQGGLPITTNGQGQFQVSGLTLAAPANNQTTYVLCYRLNTNTWSEQYSVTVDPSTLVTFGAYLTVDSMLLPCLPCLPTTQASIQASQSPASTQELRLRCCRAWRNGHADREVRGHEMLFNVFLPSGQRKCVQGTSHSADHIARESHYPHWAPGATLLNSCNPSRTHHCRPGLDGGVCRGSEQSNGRGGDPFNGAGLLLHPGSEPTGRVFALW